MKVEILRTSGQTETHEIERSRAMDDILRLIGASIADTVNLRDGRVMIVDDSGYETVARQTALGVALDPVRALKPVNEAATALYWAICRPGTTHQIVGDVAIVRDEDFA